MLSSEMNVLIACHAGAGLGLGHLTRSIVVARALQRELGAHVQLLIQGDPVTRADLAEFNHQFLGLEQSLDNKIQEQAQQLDAGVVVLDLHPQQLPANIDNLLRLLRQSGHKVIGVDSLVSHRGNLDLLFIPSFRFLLPESLTSDAPILYGWDCYLLNVKGTAVDWRPGNQVLALAGGSDATGLGDTWPTLLDAELPVDTELHWVTGPYARQPVWPSSPQHAMINHQSPAGLDDLIRGANYAATIFGVTFFELLHYGVPTVVFSPYGNKDDAELAAIAEEGVALVAVDEADAVAKLNALMANDELATTLSRTACQKLSVSGGHTLAQAVAGLVA
jgi:spore coat polysaccharide biosynthesis predicted glycosyltransferase SpsG